MAFITPFLTVILYLLFLVFINFFVFAKITLGFRNLLYILSPLTKGYYGWISFESEHFAVLAMLFVFFVFLLWLTSIVKYSKNYSILPSFDAVKLFKKVVLNPKFWLIFIIFNAVYI